MSVIVEVSFENDAELLAVTERLRDLPLKVSRHYQKPGAKYRRVYLRGNALPTMEPNQSTTIDNPKMNT